jgi:class 3 adenylate cyclase
MDWHVVCPHCGFIVDSLHSMSQLHTHAVCPICGSEKDYALDDYIQVAFSISPQVRDIQYHHPDSLSIEDLYLNFKLSKDVLSPLPQFSAWRDVIVHLTRFLAYVRPGEKVATQIALPPGVLRATDGHNCLQLSATHAPQPQPSSVSLQVIDGKFKTRDDALQPRSLTLRTADNQPLPFRFDLERELPSGTLTIEVDNQQSRRCALCIYQPGEIPTPVLALRPGLNGKRLLTTQTFRDLFRSEVIHPDETLSIRDITFLFTDLKGSTAMYEQIGDAKAYFLVRQHFDALSRVIRERHGAIVKTIGDAVMAVFDNPVEATSAALEMIEAINKFNRTISQHLALKIGIHRGHSMAVTVNERIDYFGQSVNIAARVQGLAGANEVYLTADVFNSPGVQDTLKAHHVLPDEVLVKGVSEKLQVYKIGHGNPQ